MQSELSYMFLVSNMLIKIIQIVSPAKSIKIFFKNLRHIEKTYLNVVLVDEFPELEFSQFNGRI